MDQNHEIGVIFSFPLRLGVPGIGITALMEATSLLTQGVDVRVLCGTIEDPNSRVKPIAETLRIAGRKLPIRLLGRSGAARIHDRTVARYVARTIREEGSTKRWIVHAWPLGAEFTFKVAESLGVTHLLERQNSHIEYARREVEVEYNTLGLSIRTDANLARPGRVLAHELKEYSLASGLLCPSEFVKDTFVSKGFSPEVLYRHHYGYNQKQFSSVNRRPAKAAFTALFVGRGEPRKGLHIALQAWCESSIASYGEFTIIGHIDKSYRSRLAKWLSHKSVTEVGFVRNVQDYMAVSDVLLLPSIEEGSALVTYEAAACGCVPLVSSSTGVPLTPGTACMVHPTRDIQTLKSQLESLANDSLRLAKIRESCLREARDLTWDHAGQQLVRCYHQALRAAETTTGQPSNRRNQLYGRGFTHR